MKENIRLSVNYKLEVLVFSFFLTQRYTKINLQPRMGREEAEEGKMVLMEMRKERERTGGGWRIQTEWGGSGVGVEGEAKPRIIITISAVCILSQD